MKQVILTIKSNKALTAEVYRMVLTGDVSSITAPGQFVNIKLDGLFLRRPISVCDIEGSDLTIVYKVVGRGTGLMSTLNAGDELDVLTGLGNGYTIHENGLCSDGIPSGTGGPLNSKGCEDRPVLVGGGAGVPPLYYLAKKLIAQGMKTAVVLGFNTAEEIFYEEEFRRLGCEVTVATVDGSYGLKGFVTDALKGNAGYTCLYACGPEPMLKAVYAALDIPGQFSFEERMGCGFGACMGCSCRTVTGYKRICRDGPVLFREEILWDR